MKQMIVAALAAIAPAALGQTPPLPRVSGPLSVAQAVQQGLKSNLTVQAMHAGARAAGEETKAARAMTLPQVSANTFLTTGSMESMIGSSPGVTPQMSIDLPSKPYADQNLSLMVPLYTGGRLRSLVRAAAGRERAATAGVGTAQIDVALSVKDAYYRALLGDELVKVAQTRVDADTELVKNARALYEAGKGIEAQVSRAEAELADAQQMLTRTQNERDKQVLDLKRAMGVQLDSDISLSDSLSYTPTAGDVNASLTEAERQRPDLAAARYRVEAARAQVGATRGSLAPQVYGTVMADAFSPQQDMGAGVGYTAGVTVSLPLFDAGQRRAEVAQAQAMEARTEAELRDSQLMVANDVRQAWLDIGTADQNFDTAQAGLTAAQQAYDVIALRVQSQKGIQVELLDSIAALTQARANLAQAVYDHAIASARLQRAVGRTQ